MNLRNNKGITIISLIVTIIVLFVITGVVFTEMNTGNKFKEYQSMRADIEVIKNSVLVYYNKYVGIPAKNNTPLTSVNLNGQASTNDDENYYEVDLNKLGNLTLNYGKGNVENKDIYIVNKKSLEVYYLKGIEYEGEIKHK